MRKQKPVHVFKITNDTYIVYRLSQYAHESVKAISTGLSFDGMGNFSTSLENKLKKYNINKLDDRFVFLCQTKDDMIMSIYLNQNSPKEYKTANVPDRVLKRGERLLNDSFNKADSRGERIIKNIVKYLGDKHLIDKDKTTEVLMSTFKAVIGQID